jgi:hypothetical protein
MLAAGVLAGCASSPQGIVPDPPLERHALPSWPRQSIALEVVDVRYQRDDSEALVQVTAVALSDALAAATAPPKPPRSLRVEIVLHDVSLNGPVWIATTRFRALLIEGDRRLETWEARGEQRQMNWGPADARAAAQAAYHRALTDLVRRMESFPP